ncbi:MAG: hypothetical protein EBV57_05235 [Betaproteobacteria bacterium]|nr:hypothetical protein [Betaproteobacteria bacterium]
MTVPAGTFRVARYERVMSYYDDDPFRWRTERRETLWYAPEVQHWVRRELAGTWTRPPYQRGRRGATGHSRQHSQRRDVANP